ncbi:MAG: hypothetical protein WC729_29950 [Sphingomonas sp.]|jgi:hypothetical protein|uniref:hypothetical protein n=1 Tax=Sphingomonas sp. TaxID=28214 RepID=UPI0035669E6B
MERDAGRMALAGRGGALRGLDVKRWLYIEPYFRLLMSWPRGTPLHALVGGATLRGERDLEKVARAAQNGPESQSVIEVVISTPQYESCPRTLDYWLQDLNRATEKMTRQSAGSSSAVTFYAETLCADPGRTFIGVMTGKGRPAPMLPEQQSLNLPSRKATAPVPPAHREPLQRLAIAADGMVRATRQPMPRDPPTKAPRPARAKPTPKKASKGKTGKPSPRG